MSDYSMLCAQLLQAADPRFGTVLAVGLGIMCMISGPLMVLWVIESDRQAARRATWPSADGEVVSTTILPFPSRYTSHEVRVRYRYHVNGKEYHSSTVNPTHYAFQGKAAAQAGADRYPVGARVTVYYDPEKPRSAVLQRSDPPSRTSRILLTSAAILCFLFGLVILIGIWMGAMY